MGLFGPPSLGQDLGALLESGAMEQESTSGPVRVYVHILQFKVERQAAISMMSMEEVFVCWSLLVSLRERMLEVLKSMQDLKIKPDNDTLSKYVFPAFANIEEARHILKDAGISLESEGFFTLKVRSLAATNLAELHTLLSDPSCPATELIVFRMSLVNNFKTFSDMESMVKITKLLSKDQRFSKEGKTASGKSISPGWTGLDHHPTLIDMDMVIVWDWDSGQHSPAFVFARTSEPWTPTPWLAEA
nr:PREDICTED: uncharacterized protein LOC104963297 [Notothenia coriiceps]